MIKSPAVRLSKPVLQTWKRWLLVAAALMPVAVLAWYSYSISAASMRKLVQQNNDAAAGTTAVLVERELTRSIAFAQTLAELPGNLDFISRRAERDMSERLKAIVDANDDIDRATITDPSGIMWSDFPFGGEALGQDVSKRDWFSGVSRAWQPHVTGVYQRLSDHQQRVVVVAAPIKLDGKPIGILAVHYQLEKIARWLDKIKIGSSGYVIVLDSKGTVVVRPGIDLQQRDVRDYASLLPVRNALEGRAASADYVDPLSGETVVASLVPVLVAGSHWVIIAQQPADVAYKPIRALRIEIEVAGIIFALLAFGATLVLNRMSSKVDRLNAELKERNHSLAQLALIVQSSNDAILSTRLDGTIASWNPGAERMFGYSADEAVGQSASLYIPERLAGEMDELLSRVRQGERIENRETVRVTKDKRELTVSLSIAPLRSEEGRIEGTTTLARDVSEQRRTEHALRENIERFQLVSQGTNDGLWDWNIETNAVYFSPRWKDMLGYRDDEIPNVFSEWESRVHPDDLDLALVTIRNYLENRTGHYELEHRMRHKDGRYLWILARGFALRRADGKAYRMAGSHLDLTQRKDDAEKLAIKARELSRSNSELEQFAYVASHDLREPLRMISSFGQHLAKRCKDKFDAVETAYLGQVLDGAERMKDLIADLLEFSRVGTQGNPFAPVDCNVVLAQAQTNLKIAIEESGGTIVSSELPTVSGDAIQLTQVFQNLIGNALKFKGSEKPRVEIRVEPRDGGWLFAVKDNGIGIDPQHFKRIFAIFQRLHTREDYPGTGIGLSLCKRIIERHGGTIWVESEPGQGAVFYFTMT